MGRSANTPRAIYRLGRMKSGRCTAVSKSTGQQCRARAVLGAEVCRVHGGLAPQVLAAARGRIAAYLAAMVDPQQVLYEAAKVAYADPRTLFDARGNLLPLDQWPDEASGAVASMEVTKRNLTAGDGKQEDVVRIRFWDKLKALELLGTHLELFTQKVDVRHEIDIVSVLQEGRARVAAAKAVTGLPEREVVALPASGGEDDAGVG